MYKTEEKAGYNSNSLKLCCPYEQVICSIIVCSLHNFLALQYIIKPIMPKQWHLKEDSTSTIILEIFSAAPRLSKLNLKT